MKAIILSVILVPLAIAAGFVWAEGFILGDSKEELELDYEVSVSDHGTGRVTVRLEIADEGKLEPITAVELIFPNTDGTNYLDLVVALATREVDGKRTARLHLKRELAERAQIRLQTRHLDGKKEALTSYAYVIPIADYLKKSID